jgi:predicted RNA binding protein YcfA (HicA-like mRNA interferase family)
VSKREKLLQRLFSRPKDFRWDELCALLSGLGFEKVEGDGSRVEYIHRKLDCQLHLHRPHPGNEVKSYVIKEVIAKLKEVGIEP